MQGPRGLSLLQWPADDGTGAHLVEDVLPDVPVRQWVLSVPYRLRYLLAWGHDLCRAVAAILSRPAIFRVLRERATDAGVEGGRGGGVVVIQRFGGSLNLNVHFHALVLDGVFERLPDDAMRFHPTRRLAPVDVDDVLATVEALVARRLRRAGVDSASEDGESLDRWADEAPVLADLAATSVVGGGVLGARSAWRAAAVAHGRGAADADRPEPPGAGDAAARARPTPNASWATLMRRACGFDVLSCPRCGGRLRLLALITQAAVVERILEHIGEPIAIPRPRPARAPPELRQFAEFSE